MKIWHDLAGNVYTGGRGCLSSLRFHSASSEMFSFALRIVDSAVAVYSLNSLVTSR